MRRIFDTCRGEYKMDAWLQAILLYPVFALLGFFLGSFLVFYKCRQGVIQQLLAYKYAARGEEDE